MKGNNRLKLINGRRDDSGKISKYRTTALTPILTCEFPGYDIRSYLAIKDVENKK